MRAAIGWDANPPGDSVTGYKIYWGTSSGQYMDTISVGNVTHYTLDVPYWDTIYVAITAINANGESSLSSEVSKTEAAPIHILMPCAMG